ncbi:3-isopropylmalate dehydratase small subunit [Sphingomonas crocodyli]|uniref:3-isopropylmalate dehydratase small subunit n=1 Tax=Sphingomonas crocodyli TaxID=1979270 RepID=A0A437M0F2_9SPHN|nr:3-isopropylmalate dehydratase small subunit [Sphingomonas crocodyli]RVT90994.1 3-isopropylmalate dehydratase small subunit [Sphingomonas crocodyli]
MTPFSMLSATAAPLLRNNVDTDAIIPSREMKSVGKTGLADGLFAGWRYTAIGSRDPNPDFILNQPDFADAAILLSGENFGCGSSREHAAWALAEYGFRVVIAPSFNPIFRGNCVRNGIVPVEADAAAIAADLEAVPGPLKVDLPNQTVTAPSGRSWTFAIEDEGKTMLLGGLDAIDLTLTRKAEIAAFHDRDRKARPWVYL